METKSNAFAGPSGGPTPHELRSSTVVADAALAGPSLAPSRNRMAADLMTPTNLANGHDVKSNAAAQQATVSQASNPAA